MNNLIAINGKQCAIKEYNGQRVVTFKDIDVFHGRLEGTARKRFNDNRKHFIEGVDYFVRKTDEAAKEYGIIAPNGLILIAESGYLMLVKTFADPLAWQVQRELVNNYFRGRSPETKPKPNKALETSEYCYFKKTYKGEPVITIYDFEYFTGVHSPNLRHYLKKLCKLGEDYLLLSGTEIEQYKRENPNASRLSSVSLVLKESAVRKLLNHFKLSVEIPMIEEKKSPPVPATEKEEPTVSVPQIVTADNAVAALEVLLYLKKRYGAKQQFDLMLNVNRIIKDVGLLVAGMI